MSDLDLAVVKGNARSSGYARAVADWYVEPRRAIDELLDVEAFVGNIWDPACGGGNIPTACFDRGYSVYATDIVDRGYGRVADFLSQDIFSWVDNIITNPPFKCSVAFTLRALEQSKRKVAILQRTTWLEGEARYGELFSLGLLSRVWQFRKRISMPPGGSGTKATNGSVAFAWYVFDRAHIGAPAIGWLP